LEEGVFLKSNVLAQINPTLILVKMRINNVSKVLKSIPSSRPLFKKCLKRKSPGTKSGIKQREIFPIIAYHGSPHIKEDKSEEKKARAMAKITIRVIFF